MKVVEFRERNRVFAEDQPEYIPLPAHLADDGTITCCWRMSWRERIRALLTGVIWHQVLTFGEPLQPQKLTTEKPEMRE